MELLSFVQIGMDRTRASILDYIHASNLINVFETILFRFSCVSFILDISVLPTTGFGHPTNINESSLEVTH